MPWSPALLCSPAPLPSPHARHSTGVSPLLRGVEIGLAHGFLLVGPFIKLGPLRNVEVRAVQWLWLACVPECCMSAGARQRSCTLRKPMLQLARPGGPLSNGDTLRA